MRVTLCVCSEGERTVGWSLEVPKFVAIPFVRTPPINRRLTGLDIATGGRGWTDVRREAPVSAVGTLDVECEIAGASDFVLQPRPHGCDFAVAWGRSGSVSEER